jgi:hypothetical protein
MDNKSILYLAAAGTAVFFLLPKKGAAAAAVPTNTNTVTGKWGKSTSPRGIRNKNPLNLIQTSIQWQGKIPLSQNTDTYFEQFYNEKYGIRAGIKDLRNDIITDGTNTLKKIIYEFAPPFENATENYISTIVQMTGIDKDQILTGTKAELKKIVQSFANYENYGIKPLEYTISTDLFNSAYALI